MPLHHTRVRQCVPSRWCGSYPRLSMELSGRCLAHFGRFESAEQLEKFVTTVMSRLDQDHSGRISYDEWTRGEVLSRADSISSLVRQYQVRCIIGCHLLRVGARAGVQCRAWTLRCLANNPNQATERWVGAVLACDAQLTMYAPHCAGPRLR